MNTDMKDYIQNSHKMEWQPLIEEGIDTKGLFVKSLKMDDENKRPVTFLLKFEPGSRYPYHNHPGGEEIWVIEGSCEIENELLNSGDFLYTPPNFKHGVKSEAGCVLLLMVPEEVEILEY